MYYYLAIVFGTLFKFINTVLLIIVVIKFISLVFKSTNLIKMYRSEYEDIERLKQGSVNIHDLHNLSPIEFEHWCAQLLESKGYTDVTLTPESNDGGKDIVCKKGTDLFYVECKRYLYSTNADYFIDIEIVRKLIGAMEGDNIKNGIIMTSGIVTQEVIDYVNSLPSTYTITIYDGKDLVSEHTKIKGTVPAEALS
jgi:restriction endonuclease Mrr